MALQADAKIANIEGSIREFIRSNLASSFSSGAAIDYGGGQPFSDTTYSEWLQVRLLETARPRGRQGNLTLTLYAREVLVMLNLNIFIRPAKLSTLNSLRLQTLRDTVVNVFRSALTIIPVKNYAGDSSDLGALLVDELEADRQIQDESRKGELLQWNIVWSLRWTESWS